MKYIELNNELMIKNEHDFFDLDKDKQALWEFLSFIENKTVKFSSLQERFDFLIKEKYYDNVLEKYSITQIQSLYNLAYDAGFEFASFMAANKFYLNYALKTNDGNMYLENYQDRVVAVAMYLGQGNMEQASHFTIQMIKQNYQPATPTFLNAGRKRRGEMVSCYLLELDDSLNSISFNISTSLYLSKMGGAVALNLSKLRSRGDAIKGFANACSGVVPVMKLLEDTFSYANQLGQRKGAGAVYLNIFHNDIIEFLDTKKINADEKSRIATLAIGLIVPSKFFDLVEKNQAMYVFAPYSVFEHYGKHMDDLDLDCMYDELICNPNVKKSKLDLSARDLLIKIAMIQLESGYPYMMYKSNANDNHALKDLGQVKMSNLCTEIFQLQETSKINDYDTPDLIKRDISCILGSLNIANVMENKEIAKSVNIGMRALTSVVQMTSLSNAPSIRKANEELRAVGLGAMNLHGYLAKNKIDYDSPLAVEFVDTFFMMLNFYSLQASMQIAKENKSVFKDFEKSEYQKGTYFDKYIKHSFAPKTKKIIDLFEGMYIPTPKDWNLLKLCVQKYGLYHAYRIAIAPTQSISYVQNATASVMPVVDAIETRTYADSTTYFPMPFLQKENFLYYKSAYNIDQMKIIDIVATMQNHVDQGISTTLFVKSNISTKEIARYCIYAHKKGLKSLYYTRTRHQTVEDCLSCSV
ncbi:MAG: class 1b ribonucleoside-diphosphate reductase subunit alpha [Clostridiales bacterium]|jgi:ribonucleoside-diphosphate reductase alpha chain|nr:class 1b ribonucleoside-diphosphate reductase subunit alpha [Clostridiales bacterium]